MCRMIKRGVTKGGCLVGLKNEKKEGIATPSIRERRTAAAAVDKFRNKKNRSDNIRCPQMSERWEREKQKERNLFCRRMKKERKDPGASLRQRRCSHAEKEAGTDSFREAEVEGKKKRKRASSNPFELGEKRGKHVKTDLSRREGQRGCMASGKKGEGKSRQPTHFYLQKKKKARPRTTPAAVNQMRKKKAWVGGG